MFHVRLHELKRCKSISCSGVCRDLLQSLSRVWQRSGYLLSINISAKRNSFAKPAEFANDGN
jgi:hypothetical protein